MVTFALRDLRPVGQILGTLGVATVAGAQTANQVTTLVTDYLSLQRGTFGAVHNRLRSALAGLQVSRENLAASRSRIADVDFAVETAELAKDSILQAASLAVLAQANTQPALALALLDRTPPSDEEDGGPLTGLREGIAERSRPPGSARD